jgi:hypothetical protein
VADRKISSEGQEMAEPLRDLPDWLLPGENPAVSNREDVEHWLSVYEELARFCDQLLCEVATHDKPAALVAHRRRLQRRVAFWRRRELETRLIS